MVGKDVKAQGSEVTLHSRSVAELGPHCAPTSTITAPPAWDLSRAIVSFSIFMYGLVTSPLQCTWCKVHWSARRWYLTTGSFTTDPAFFTEHKSSQQLANRTDTLNTHTHTTGNLGLRYLELVEKMAITFHKKFWKIWSLFPKMSDFSDKTQNGYWHF